MFTNRVSFVYPIRSPIVEDVRDQEDQNIQHEQNQEYEEIQMPADDLFMMDDFIINDDYGQFDDLTDQQEPELAAVNEDIATQSVQLQHDLDAAHPKLDELTEETQYLVISTGSLSAQLDQTRCALEQSKESEQALQSRLAAADLENVTIKRERDKLLGQVARHHFLAEALFRAETTLLQIPDLQNEATVLKASIQLLSSEKQSVVIREQALQNQLEESQQIISEKDHAIFEGIRECNSLRQDLLTISTDMEDISIA